MTSRRTGAVPDRAGVDLFAPVHRTCTSTRYDVHSTMYDVRVHSTMYIVQVHSTLYIVGLPVRDTIAVHCSPTSCYVHRTMDMYEYIVQGTCT